MNPSNEDAAWEQFETAGEILGFIWRKFGERGLRDGLAMLAEEGQMHREFMQQAGRDLSLVGFKKAAAIVGELAATLPPDPRLAKRRR